MRNIKSTIVLLTFLIFSGETYAGIVDVAVDPGKRAFVGAIYNDGSSFSLMINERNGGARVVIPNQENVSRGIVITQFDGKVFNLTLSMLGIGGLASLEPFSVPAFSSFDENVFLVSLFDMDSFLSSGVTFSEGETANAISGIIENTPNIIFFDGSILPDDIESAGNLLLDSSFISTLPEYSGDIKAVTTAQFSTIPVPSTLILLLGSMPLFFFQRSL